MSNNSTLLPEKDPMGRAIADYHAKGKAGKLRVFSSMFYEDEIPVEHLFRTYGEMPELEQRAIDIAKGRVLDVGAGSGCHAVELTARGHEVVTIEISPLSVTVMKERGIDAREINLFDETFTEKFDTMLMAMNGIGIVGKTENLEKFFRCARRLLNDDGCILLDSSDIRYIYENEDGSMDINLNAAYYGEVDFSMRYKNIKGDAFDWLYIDFDTLQMYASENGFECEKIMDGEHYDYLARVTRRNAGK